MVKIAFQYFLISETISVFETFYYGLSSLKSCNAIVCNFEAKNVFEMTKDSNFNTLASNKYFSECFDC